MRAAPAVAARRLSGAPDDAPLRVRIVRRGAGLVTLTQTGFAQVDSTRPHVARDLAADVVRLLSSPAEIMDGDRRVPVRPGHLAILVPTNRQASLVRDALAEVGVSAVINGAGSVFGTRAADEWLRLLRAIERPASPSLAASAALTGFLGWTAVRLAEVGDADLEELHAHLHRLGAVLRARGVATLLETVATGTGLAARILAERDGERTMTDLRHVGQLLHEAAAEGQLGVSALAAWLSERIAQAGQDTANEDRSRRLESDAEAVQVLTIHRSKGLEFPIVYCPFLWDRGRPPDRRRRSRSFTAPTTSGRSTSADRRAAGFAPHYALARRGGAWRGSAPRLRRPHPRPPSGGPVVGGLTGQRQLPARPPALLDGLRRQRRHVGRRDAVRRRGPEGRLRPRGPSGLRERGVDERAARHPMEPAGGRPGRRWPRRPSTGGSTRSGGAPPTRA